MSLHGTVTDCFVSMPATQLKSRIWTALSKFFDVFATTIQTHLNALCIGPDCVIQILRTHVIYIYLVQEGCDQPAAYPH